ncbi:MAG TPA: hypothetical protein VF954_00765, partial [Acidimicrobiales bacterium]
MTAITLPSSAGAWSTSRTIGWPAEVARRPEVVGGSAGGRGVASRFGGGGTRAQPPSVYRRRRLGAVLVVATVALGARALALGLA